MAPDTGRSGASCRIAVRSALAVAYTGYVEFNNLSDDDIAYVQRNPALLEGFGTVTNLKDAYNAAIASRHDGFFTGASGRNWEAYGKDVSLAAAVTPAQQALLTDPQTSGGLLVSCDAASVDEVLALFRREGFGEAAVIGRMAEGAPRIVVSA